MSIILQVSFKQYEKFRIFCESLKGAGLVTFSEGDKEHKILKRGLN